MMATNIKETSQHAVIAAHDHDRFTGDVARDVVARFRDLVAARGKLP